jgi:hypothetical protein
MKKIIYFFMGIILFSCDNDDDDCCTNIESSIFITVVDDNGNDLLNDINSINPDDIKIFYRDNAGQDLVVDNSNLDARFGFIIEEMPNSNNVLQLFVNTEFIDNGQSFTKIEWGNNNYTDDVIEIIFIEQSNNLIIESVIINSVNFSNQLGTGTITIIK